MKAIIGGGLVMLLCPCVALGQVEVTYLANEGFLLEGGGKKVLIDALFGDGLAGYATVPQPMRSRLESAQPPFNDVDMVLASHYHGDHFDADAVGRFLKASPSSRFVSTPQAARHVARSGELPAEKSVADSGAGLQILNLHHGRDGNPPVQNLGFIVTLGGVRVLHIGDTEATIDDYPDPMPAVEVALLPAWYLTYPQWVRVVREVIRPESIVVMHLSPPGTPARYFGPDGSYEGRVAKIRANFPEAIILEIAGDSQVFR